MNLLKACSRAVQYGMPMRISMQYRISVVVVAVRGDSRIKTPILQPSESRLKWRKPESGNASGASVHRTAVGIKQVRRNLRTHNRSHLMHVPNQIM